MHDEGGACVVCTAGHCAGGTHPTGMHSCSNGIYVLVLSFVSFLGATLLMVG